MVYKNQANNKTTNIFDCLSGVLNIAPIKISGQYKIVVALDGNLYLDDYSGRRSVLDIEKDFLPQVANFLRVETQVVSLNDLRYGAFQKSTNKYFHIPFYFASEESLPTHFILNRVPNENIVDSTFLQKYAQIIQLIDLEKIGLYKIFAEINKEPVFDYPLYLNWEDDYLRFFGYSITKDTVVDFNLDLLYNKTNQPYFHIFNNKILNTFVDNNVFFPRFLNIEFEFFFNAAENYFNNFYGFLSYSEEIGIADITNQNIFAKIKNNLWEQQTINTPTPTLDEYINILGTVTIQEIANREPQIRYRTSNININDVIIIRNENDDIEFEYIITETDIIKTSLQLSLLNITENATIKSGRIFIFEVKQVPNTTNQYYFKIKFANLDDGIYNYSIEVPNYFTTIDRFEKTDYNFNKLRGIQDTDIWLRGQSRMLENIENIKINGYIYTILEKFKFDGNIILRLDSNPEITRLTTCDIYETLNEKLFKFTPISFLSYYSNLEAELQYNQDSYVTQLRELFINENDLINESSDSSIAKKAIDIFSQKNIISKKQYVIEENNELDATNIVTVEKYNETEVLNIMFGSTGHTTFITPNILNIDFHFYTHNGNVDADLLNYDELRYSWVLIKNQTPAYLINTINELRYFTNKPKLTSKLLKVSSISCETIFLGVKYSMPVKYENYDFAVYLTLDNVLDVKLSYHFIIDNLNKTLYLSVNNYIDFVDLIRGANNSNQSLVDLSFFYNASNSFNTNSDNITTFKNGGLEIVPKINIGDTYLFNTIYVPDWKYFETTSNKWFILVKRESILIDSSVNDLRLLFPSFNNVIEDSTLYVYSTIEYEGNIFTYISISISIKGIRYVYEDYLWCEDIQFKFYDTERIFLQKYDIHNIAETFYVEKTELINYTNQSTNIYGDFVQIATLFVNGQNQNFKLTIPNKTLSFKEHYFEITQNVYTNEDGTVYGSKSVFKFPDFFRNDLTNAQIIDLFDTSTIDYTILSNKITLFDKNQIWKAIRDIIRVDIKFKQLFESQVRVLLNNFMVTNLIDYTKVNSIPIKNVYQEFIKLEVIDSDRNIGVWKLNNIPKIVAFNRYSGIYKPYMQLVDNELQFQIEKFKSNNSFFNIYDKNFGGTNISATGLWDEVQGNVVSSLFCKNNDIELTTIFAKSINYKNLLIKYFNIDNCIINNDNKNYLSSYNKNINEYILDTFVDYILENFYYFFNLTNEFGERIPYVLNEKNKTIIEINDKNSFHNNFDNLKFIFKRK